MSYQAIYVWARKEAPEMLKEYQQAVKQTMKSAGGENRFVSRPALIKAIIAELKAGKKVVASPNAIEAACNSLGTKVYHWATIHRWLRDVTPELKQEFHAAVKGNKKQSSKSEALKNE
jgi:uncharacterized protein (DUF1330 family)